MVDEIEDAGLTWKTIRKISRVRVFWALTYLRAETQSFIYFDSCA
jgi:hypothetical protein